MAATLGVVADLKVPTMSVRESFLGAVTEFRDEGRAGPGDESWLGEEIHRFGQHWSSPSGFAGYVAWLIDQAAEDSPRRERFVPATTLWWIQDETYLGRIAIRHRLTPGLREVGGHIGYDIRPSARGRGHATAMLRAALPVAADLGIEKALLTCDALNVASRKVIERNGGVQDDQRGEKLRFWAPTGRPVPTDAG